MLLSETGPDAKSVKMSNIALIISDVKIDSKTSFMEKMLYLRLGKHNNQYYYNQCRLHL